MKKKNLLFVIATLLMCMMLPQAIMAKGNVNVKINDKQVLSSHDIYIEDDRTLVPLRWAEENFNCKLAWDGAARMVTVASINPKDGSFQDYLLMMIDSPLLLSLEPEYVNELHGAKEVVTTEALLSHGHIRKMDVSPKIMKDRTYVPIRFLAQNLGYEVEWDAVARTVSVTAPPEAVR